MQNLAKSAFLLLAHYKLYVLADASSIRARFGWKCFSFEEKVSNKYLIPNKFASVIFTQNKTKSVLHQHRSWQDKVTTSTESKICTHWRWDSSFNIRPPPDTVEYISWRAQTTYHKYLVEILNDRSLHEIANRRVS